MGEIKKNREQESKSIKEMLKENKDAFTPTCFWTKKTIKEFERLEHTLCPRCRNHTPNVSRENYKKYFSKVIYDENLCWRCYEAILWGLINGLIKIENNTYIRCS